MPHRSFLLQDWTQSPAPYPMADLPLNEPTPATMEGYPYECEMTIALPRSTMARELHSILSVDKEVGDRVVKTFRVDEADPKISIRATAAPLMAGDEDACGTAPTKTKKSTTDTDSNIAKSRLVVQFAATEAKLLRVAVSSFTEYLTVALQCYQEFGQQQQSAASDDDDDQE